MLIFINVKTLHVYKIHDWNTVIAYGGFKRIFGEQYDDYINATTKRDVKEWINTQMEDVNTPPSEEASLEERQVYEDKQRDLFASLMETSLKIDMIISTLNHYDNCTTLR